MAAILILVFLIPMIIIWIKCIDSVDINDPKIRMCMNCDCIWCTKNPDKCFEEKENEDGR